TTCQLKAVISMPGSRLVGKPGPVQGRVQPVARTITSKEPAGAVAAMRGRRQSTNQHSCVNIAETGQRPAPVFLAAVGSPLLLGHLLAPLHKARAAPTGDNLLAKILQLPMAHGSRSNRRGFYLLH